MTIRLAVTPDGRWPYPADELAAAAGAYAAAGLHCHEVVALIFGDDESTTMTAAEQLTAAAEIMTASWSSRCLPRRSPPA
jgi:hypothetical protein